MAQGLFISGTDTDVGKSLMACSLVRMLREQGLDTVGFKPVATGEVGGSWGDAVALYEASGKCEPIEKICPQRFALPLAPTVAARREGIKADMGIARTAFVRLSNRHQVVIVEGVGGLLVPLDEKTLVIDFAGQIGFPVLLVAHAGLGTINQTLLSLRELERSKLKLAGIVMNVTRRADAPLAESSVEEIERISGYKVNLIVPHFGLDEEPDAPGSAIVARAIGFLSAQKWDVKKLLGGEGSRSSGSSGRWKRR